MSGNNLKKLRNKKGLTQSQLGEYFGLSKTAISLYENNKRGIDSNLVKSMAEFFNVTTDELLGVPPDNIKLEVNEPAQIYSVSDVDRILEDTRMALKQAIEDGNITEEKAAEAVELARRQLMLVLEQKK